MNMNMWWLPCLLSMCVVVSGGSLLMDSTGSLQLKMSDVPTTQGIVTIISSPGTASLLTESSEILTLDSQSPPCLTCRGATLSGTSNAERSALSTSSLISGAILVDGITEGDVESGWINTRHARTLTALFRARLALDTTFKQTLVLCVKGDVNDGSSLLGEVKELFEATAAETDVDIAFDELYSAQVVSVTDKDGADEAMTIAREAAAENVQEGYSTLAVALEDAHGRVRESGVAATALDPPYIAKGFVTVSNAYTKQSRTYRAKVASWRSRVSRGLWVEGFGAEAEALRERVLGSFDAETLAAAGLPLLAPYRSEMRSQLATLVDTSISELFGSQIVNVEKSTLKKLRAQLLNKLDTPPEDMPSENAAAMRAASFSFETTLDGLEVPSLSLTKAKPCRDMEAKLTDEVLTFSDSPAAQIKRTKNVKAVTGKEKKPGQRSIDFGLDLVAVLRPDGFGNFQGFAGYQLGGNNVIFGVHNDADDPQTIAQFGGVRPPLLRIQPKLRVDVEM